MAGRSALIALNVAGSCPERIMNPHFSLVRPVLLQCRKSLTTYSCRRVITCFSNLKSRNVNDLVLISFCRARDGLGCFTGEGRIARWDVRHPYC
jgi:hypothetical protein